MKKKLTLRMEKDMIERAKAYAKERGLSVSKLVENYFAALTAPRPEDDRDEDGREQLSPITRSLVGCLRGPETERFTGHPDEEGHVDADVRKEYYRYLEEKHR